MSVLSTPKVLPVTHVANHRLSMAPTRLEEVQCLKNWLRGGSIAVGGQHFVRREKGAQGAKRGGL